MFIQIVYIYIYTIHITHRYILYIYISVCVCVFLDWEIPSLLSGWFCGSLAKACRWCASGKRLVTLLSLRWWSVENGEWPRMAGLTQGQQWVIPKPFLVVDKCWSRRGLLSIPSFRLVKQVTHWPWTISGPKVTHSCPQYRCKTRFCFVFQTFLCSAETFRFLGNSDFALC